MGWYAKAGLSSQEVPNSVWGLTTGRYVFVTPRDTGLSVIPKKGYLLSAKFGY